VFNHGSSDDAVMARTYRFTITFTVDAQPCKAGETTSHADLMSASGEGSLIQATVGSFGGVGRRWRNRAGLAA
jgi:hypothetical protein